MANATTTISLRTLRVPPAMRAALDDAIANRRALTARLNRLPTGIDHEIRDLLADIERDLAIIADQGARTAPDAGISRQLTLIATAAAALSSAYAARLAKIGKD